VYVDGKLSAKVNANSPSGWNNPQPAIVLNEVTEGEHEIEIRIAEDSVNKDFHILAFGTTGTIHGQERLNEEDIAYQERAVVNVGNTYRIQKLMERAAAGEELTVGFIGGSITQGSGASSANKCYAKLVYDWWCETYPQAKFNYVNAGIGATTSQFACARVEDDLLAYEPDFIIVEFSVNDEGSGFYSETYESLINLILDKGREDVAVMVLNMVQYNNGINAQGVHNEIAKAYGIPAVSMKESIYKEITFGNLKAEDVSADMLHPNDKGHAYGAEIVTYFLTKVKDGIYTSDAPATRPQPQQELLSVTSKRYDSRSAQSVLNGFVKDEAKQNGITDIFKNGYTAKNTGDSIVFENIYGSRISLQYRKTNSLGAPLAVAVIDGNEEGAVALDGNYPDGWGNWLYLHNIADGLDASVPHTIEIRITEGTAKDFYLVSVIAAGTEEE
ncbi:MAG: SGNH/GDSL hydrolase family protein, partial [Lachnospiraceae bacterium]|nr:SGNH/GDSL hydrolase family protein [Lachnospiraceae bacterium]